MEPLTKEALQAGLLNDESQTAREQICRNLVAALSLRGRVLWGFGLFSHDPAREAIALVAQYAGELAQGAVTLFELSNWYSGAALVRQLIEVEYLAYLFATNREEPTQWHACSREDLLRAFTPGAMRRRSQDHFRDSEYWTHCDIGGHPSTNKISHGLLPDHDIYDPRHTDLMKGMLWADLGQHLEEVWNYLVAAATMHGFSSMLDNARIQAMLAAWHLSDTCADRVSAGQLQTSQDDQVE